MKYSNKPILAAAVSAVIGLGMAGQAAASVYADSYTSIYGLTLGFTDAAGNPVAPLVNSFNFAMTNTANLNGTPAISIASCAGTPSSNTCNAASPRLDAPLVALGASTRTENNMPNFEGPGASEYATADSVIYTAQLTLDPSTSVEQIAEAELQTGTSAGSSANIQSSTGFSFGFEVAAAESITVEFTADWDLYVSINDPTGINQNSQANNKVELTLSNDTTGDFLKWSPDGSLTTGCVSTFGLCTEALDDADLNDVITVSTDGAVISLFGNGDQFAFTADGLTPGPWTFGLQSETSTNLSRQVPVPEPAMLSLLGLGLAGFGAAVARRRKNKLV